MYIKCSLVTQIICDVIEIKLDKIFCYLRGIKIVIFKMNSLGWTIIFKTGCWCAKENININGTRYIVKERLAEGGFSLIDLVENSITKKSYALKRISCHSIDDQNIALREIEICKKVNSKNVIKVIDYMLKGTADIVLNTTSQLYIVLPYYKNGSLADSLTARSKTKDYMNESQILNIFLGTCEGVKALHEAKPEPLAHRDLKTANICLSDSFEAVLVDLGSATEARVQICGQQDAQRLQDLAEERCSIVYRAPELFSVQSYCTIDERTDIWSLGCVLYAMCFFKCPFDIVYEKGDSVALAVLSGNINFPDDSIYSQDMQDLILYMMRLNPMERPYIYSVIEKAQDALSKLENRL
ncbi:serine/threonine-protein kinase 16 [Condylostylus longicornis]|uniref:serine/threonine-protein kinase 16 n=1 Tax=Condylostylus longicornis TaxID=2530218 RepID=UPI00244E1FDE|nr:serine/threonine-protein kinase 16 [Condylostylus longicornis]